MVTIEEIISKPYLEIIGNGSAKLNDDIDLNGNFSAKLYSNGEIIGNFEYKNDDAFRLALSNKFQSFSLIGSTAEGQKVLIAKCGVISTQTDQSPPSLKIIFHPTKVILNPDAESSKPEISLVVRFTLLNIFDTMGFAAKTNVGFFELHHFTNNEDLEKLMELYRISCISAIGQFDIETDGSRSLEKIVTNSSKTMLDILKITSLGQTVWHNYVMVEVYEKSSDDKMIFMYGEIKWTKNSIPRKWGFIPTSYFQTFFNSAWNGYSDELHKTYGFDIALEWYIDSWTSGNVLESKFMSATTAFEMLMDKFHTQNNSEFLIDEHTFDEIEKLTKNFLKEKLVSFNVNDSDTRAAFYRNLKGLNRRSYCDKALKLLEYWKLKTDDIGTTINDIVDVRNKITHRGTYYTEGESIQELKQAFIGLEVLLTRLFLAMLNYEGLYFDWVAQKNVDFNTVRSS